MKKFELKSPHFARELFSDRFFKTIDKSPQFQKKSIFVKSSLYFSDVTTYMTCLVSKHMPLKRN